MKQFPVLRLIIVGLILLAVSGVRVPGGKQRLALVFVVDRSESAASVENSGVLEKMNELASHLSAEDEVGIVAFGREAVIEQRLQKRTAIAGIQSTPAASGTNIAKGLKLAQAMLADRKESSRRIVLVSDGLQTSGDAIKEASVAAAEGIAIDVLPVSTAAEAAGKTLFLEECTGPESVRLEEPFDIRIALRGEQGAAIELQLFRDGEHIASQKHTLAGGLEPVVFQDRLAAQGFHHYRVKIRDTDPARSYNDDEGGLVVYVSGRTRVLHIADKPAEFLDRILEKEGFEVRRRSPAMPGMHRQDIYDFASCDVVLLDNVPAARFSEDQMRALAEHVEKFAGGLIMTGSNSSFGPGGYGGTPIEKILPVEMALKNREKKPGLALVLVLDKSGSMGLEQQKISKLDMARDAVLRLSELLSPDDSLGIIAFDKAPHAMIALSANPNHTSLLQTLAKITAGGGTSILPAVEMAYQWLQASPAEKKHILLLSDGQADQSERKPLIQRIAGSQAVLSTVGIGSDVDRALLQKLADSARGRAYFSNNAIDLPEIFKREGMLISGTWIVERRFRPQLFGDHPILQGIREETWPEMTGYVATTPKKGAETPIRSDNQDPVLACWQYGLGKSLVFTSDFSSSWTRMLAQWPYFPAAWSQMVRWCSRGPQNATLHPRTSMEEDAAVLHVDSYDDTGRFINFTGLTARIVAPDSKTSEIRLRQTAPGCYEGRFPVEKKGSYLINISSDKAESLHFGLDFSKLPEDRGTAADAFFLKKLSEAARGRILSQETSASPVERAPGYRELWPVAVILALLLFIADLWLSLKTGRS